MKVACVQMCSGLERAVNVQSASQMIREAAAAGASIILTPEMTNIVDRKPKRLFSALPAEQGLEEISTFADLAEELGIWLAIGSMAFTLSGDADNQRAANRAYLFSPAGRIVNIYDKIHMFDVDLPDGESWKESSIYTAGETAAVIETPLAKIGQTICYDLRFPALYRKLAQAGAEILLIPAAFTYQTGKAHWESLLRARAIETGSYVMAAAQGGEHEDGRSTWGHSMIIDPWGKVIAVKADTSPGVIVADIDPAKVSQVRQQIPNLALEKSLHINNIQAS
ncbi:carbon-nitrogen hydrolase family protein [Parvularcula sp. IMCC14364]|uniref:carbon-nitrogen hydrolase family protein n=1 Tax=Parvularcula sp. IMCC14364 TaxID=3067902 RepID=UPI0027414C2F|nr:carbon-nitrogen hydrolase family protein [Parvularcula sp. IMCC14364]